MRNQIQHLKRLNQGNAITTFDRKLQFHLFSLQIFQPYCKRSHMGPRGVCSLCTGQCYSNLAPSVLLQENPSMFGHIQCVADRGHSKVTPLCEPKVLLLFLQERLCGSPSQSCFQTMPPPLSPPPPPPPRYLEALAPPSFRMLDAFLEINSKVLGERGARVVTAQTSRASLSPSPSTAGRSCRCV